jgi:hypothetical protein
MSKKFSNRLRLDYGIFVEMVNFIGFLKKCCNFLKVMPTIQMKTRLLLKPEVIKSFR